ncbi:fatty-acid amide hydrolase 2-B [Triplophysa dalaica]|uniref:fatty-acid amide hydrolase 2-B n=1 Tax=Triplophysa dalaica TaxID=1582913 RepID=UPI0024DF40EB|nr:fatty-acid amide hydrolase 2-B [Triplophysa dalaica]
MSWTFGERVQHFLQVLVPRLLLALFRMVSPGRSGRPKRLPLIRNPLLTLSAAQLAQKIRRREVTSVEVVQAYIDRIQEVNPLLNAIVKDRFSSALLEAAQADKKIEEKGGEDVLKHQFPLLGVPITVKESFSLQGMPNAAGLISRANTISSVDAPVVGLLKRAGAIPIGVTNTSELCMWLESNNHLYGITNNPYNLERIAGGSSGGEGSIIGGGASVIGLGSDIGGSIRLPSFFNGIFGHKGTRGVVSNDGQMPEFSGLHDDFVSTGPMCRYAEDLLPLMKIMAGPNADKLSLSQKVDLRKLRYFTVVDDGGSHLTTAVDNQLIEAQKRVVASFEADLGVTVKQVSFPQLKYAFQIWDTFLALPDKDGKPCTPFVELMAEGRSVWLVWEVIKRIFGRSEHTVAAIGLALYEKTHSKVPSQFILRQKEELQREMDELLGTDGVLLYPSHPFIAPKHHHPLFIPSNVAYTGIMNILGLPVTQCPLGLSKEQLPLGVQVVAGKFQDRLTMAVALYLEKTFGGWRDPGVSDD